jgi:hypothetical protein
MNIKFSYLYRDASNYKQFHEVVFENSGNIPFEVIQSIIISNLIDECWFVAKDWHLPDLHFKEYEWDDQIDHDCHEFSGIEETTDTGSLQTPIEDFIKMIKDRQPIT